MIKNEKNVYSYHTFIFPFTWEHAENSDLNKVFDSSDSFWKCTDGEFHKKIKYGIDLIEDGESQKSERLFYTEFQFFNEACRHVLYNHTGENMVHMYEVRQSCIQNAYYVIEESEQVYKLKLESIKLIIYNTGIAVFYMECSNRELNQANIKSVKAINEYGRRVSMSFWPEGSVHKKCADKLSIVGLKLPNKEKLVERLRSDYNSNGETDKEDSKEIKDLSQGIVSDYFKDFIEKIEEKAKEAYEEKIYTVVKESTVSLQYISKIIRTLLDMNDAGYLFQAKDENVRKKRTDTNIKIRPILDGKMFASCLIVDREYISYLKDNFDTSANCFERDAEQDLVELIDIDLQGQCSYPNLIQRREFFQQTTNLKDFTKDLAGASLMAITPHSFIRIIEEPNYIVDFHRFIHNQIIVLGLAQRTSIVNFQQEIAKISYGIENPQYKMTNHLVFRIMDLQERYVAFQNQFLLYEITPQKEGQYIYQQLRKILAVEEENNSLSNKLSGVYELANINQGYGFNKGALVLSVIALLGSMISILVDAENLVSYIRSGYIGYSVIAVDFIICILCIIVIIKCIYKK